MKKPETKPETNVEPAGEYTGAGCLVRLAWMAAGPLVLVISLVYVAEHTGSFLSASDAVFWAAAGLMVALRYLDVTRMKGQTASGKPATLRQWKRFTLLLAAFCLLAWAGAHLIAWLRRG